MVSKDIMKTLYNPYNKDGSIDTSSFVHLKIQDNKNRQQLSSDQSLALLSNLDKTNYNIGFLNQNKEVAEQELSNIELNNRLDNMPDTIKKVSSDPAFWNVIYEYTDDTRKVNKVFENQMEYSKKNFLQKVYHDTLYQNKMHEVYELSGEINRVEREGGDTTELKNQRAALKMEAENMLHATEQSIASSAGSFASSMWQTKETIAAQAGIGLVTKGPIGAVIGGTVGAVGGYIQTKGIERNAMLDALEEVEGLTPQEKYDIADTYSTYSSVIEMAGWNLGVGKMTVGLAKGLRNLFVKEGKEGVSKLVKKMATREGFLDVMKSVGTDVAISGSSEATEEVVQNEISDVVKRLDPKKIKDMGGKEHYELSKAIFKKTYDTASEVAKGIVFGEKMSDHAKEQLSTWLYTFAGSAVFGGPSSAISTIGKASEHNNNIDAMEKMGIPDVLEGEENLRKTKEVKELIKSALNNKSPKAFDEIFKRIAEANGADGKIYISADALSTALDAVKDNEEVINLFNEHGIIDALNNAVDGKIELDYATAKNTVFSEVAEGVYAQIVGDIAWDAKSMTPNESVVKFSKNVSEKITGVDSEKVAALEEKILNSMSKKGAKEKQLAHTNAVMAWHLANSLGEAHTERDREEFLDEIVNNLTIGDTSKDGVLTQKIWHTNDDEYVTQWGESVPVSFIWSDPARIVSYYTSRSNSMVDVNKKIDESIQYITDNYNENWSEESAQKLSEDEKAEVDEFAKKNYRYRYDYFTSGKDFHVGDFTQDQNNYLQSLWYGKERKTHLDALKKAKQLNLQGGFTKRKDKGVVSRKKDKNPLKKIKTPMDYILDFKNQRTGDDLGYAKQEDVVLYIAENIKQDNETFYNRQDKLSKIDIEQLDEQEKELYNLAVEDLDIIKKIRDDNYSIDDINKFIENHKKIKESGMSSFVFGELGDYSQIPVDVFETHKIMARNDMAFMSEDDVRALARTILNNEANRETAINNIINNTVSDNKIENVEAKLNRNSDRVEFNYRSLKDPVERKYMEKMLGNKAGYKEAVERMNEVADYIYNEVKRTNASSSFIEKNDKAVAMYQDSNGEWYPIRSIFVNNGDYEFNIDFGTVCVKRQGTDTIVKILVDKEKGSQLGVVQLENLKRILTKYGIATACDICFVETKRINARDLSNGFAYEWESVRQAIGINDEYEIGHNYKFTKEQNSLLERMASLNYIDDDGHVVSQKELDDMKKAMSKEDYASWKNNHKQEYQVAYEEIFGENGRLHERARGVKITVTKEGKENKTAIDRGITAPKMRMIAKLFQQESRLAGRFNPDRLMNSKDTSDLVHEYFHTDMLIALSSYAGSGTPKPLLASSPYSELSWRNIIDTKDNKAEIIEKLFDIGGVRSQSFSDYDPFMVIDYLQKYIAQYLRGLPSHTYTKEPSLIRTFGKIGDMFNMSIIPEVIENIEIPHNISQKKREEYIKKNKEYAGLKRATQEQIDAYNNSVKKGTVKEDLINGKIVNVMTDEKGSWTYAWHQDSFPIEEALAFRRDDAYQGRVGIIAVGVSLKQIKMMLNDPTIDMVIPFHSSSMPAHTKIVSNLIMANDYEGQQTTKIKDGEDFNYNEHLRKIKDPRKTAKAYLEWCKVNKATPKFPELIKEENYYKVLEDFRGYDNNGNPVIQQAINIENMKNDWEDFKRIAYEEILKKEKENIRFKKIKSSLDEKSADNDSIELSEQEKKIADKFKQDILDALEYQRLDATSQTVVIRKLKDIFGNSNVIVVDQKRLLSYLYDINKNKDAEDSLHEYRRERDGVIYGFAYKDKIYINENHMNAHTPAHEFTHIWVKVIREYHYKDPKTKKVVYPYADLWEQGKKLLKSDQVWLVDGLKQFTGEDVWTEVLNDPNYYDLSGDEDLIASEVLSRIVGRQNELFVSAMTNPNEKLFTEEGKNNFLKKAYDWLQKFFNAVMETFGWKKGDELTSLKEFVRMPFADMMIESRAKDFKSKYQAWKKQMEGEQEIEFMKKYDDEVKSDIDYIMTRNARLYQESDNSIQTEPKDNKVQKGVAGFFDTKTLEIRLTSASNPTTFAHEAMHYFMYNMVQMYNEGSMSEEWKKKFEKAMKWAGAEKDEHGTYSFDVNDPKTRAAQEKLAEGWTAYLMKGEAPSYGTRDLFKVFKMWFKAVYAKLRMNKVKLNKDVTDFFDQIFSVDGDVELLATQEKLGMMEKPEGVSDEQWAAYQKAKEDAKDAANSEALKIIAKRTKLQTEQAYKDVFDKFFKEKLEELKEDPAYTARAEMLRVKVSKESVERVAGEGKLDKRFIATDKDIANPESEVIGEDIEVLANKFGFGENILEFIDWVNNADSEKVTAEEYAKEMADAWIDENYPELRKVSAEHALRNIAAMKVNIYEYMILNKIPFNQFNMIFNEMTKTVEGICATMSSKELANSEKLERRLKAVLDKIISLQNTNTTKGLASLKYRAAMLNYMIDISKAARDKRIRFAKKFNKYRKFPTNANLRNIDGQAWNLILDILYKYKMTSRHTASPDIEGRLQEFIEHVLDNGYSSIEDIKGYEDILINENGVSADTMPFGDFVILDGVLRDIEAAGKTLKQIVAKEERLALEDAENQIKDYADKNGIRARSSEDKGINKMKNWWMNGVSIMETQLSELMPTELFKKYILPFFNGMNLAIEWKNNTSKRIMEIIKPVLQKQSRLIRVAGHQLTVLEGLVIMLNAGNKHNLKCMAQTLFEKKGIETDINQIIQELPSAIRGAGVEVDIRDVAQSVWDIFEETAPAMKEAQRQLNGREVNLIQATPITFADGKTIRGGYYPAKGTDYTGDVKNIKDTSNFIQKTFSFTLDRTGQVHGDLPLDLTMLTSWVGQIGKLMFVSNPANNIMKLTNSKLIESAWGDERIKSVKEWLALSISPEAIDPLIAKASSLGSVLILGGNIAKIFVQMLGFTAAIAYTGFHIIPSLIKCMTLVGWRSGYNNARSKSAYIRNRYSDPLNHLYNAKSVENIFADAGSKGYDRAMKVFMSAVTLGDNFAATVVWDAVYNKSINEGMTEQDAILSADSAVRRTQGDTSHGSRPKAIQGWKRLLSPFCSYFLAVHNIVTAKMQHGDAKSKLEATIMLAMYGIVVPYIESILSSYVNYYGYSDEDKRKKRIKDIVSFRKDSQAENMITSSFNILLPVGGVASYPSAVALRAFDQQGFINPTVIPHEPIIKLTKVLLAIVDEAKGKDSADIMKEVEKLFGVDKILRSGRSIENIKDNLFN